MKRFRKTSIFNILNMYNDNQTYISAEVFVIFRYLNHKI